MRLTRAFSSCRIGRWSFVSVLLWDEIWDDTTESTGGLGLACIPGVIHVANVPEGFRVGTSYDIMAGQRGCAVRQVLPRLPIPLELMGKRMGDRAIIGRYFLNRPRVWPPPRRQLRTGDPIRP